jgi:hypothetical protein
MSSFKEGYEYFEKNMGGYEGARYSEQYLCEIEQKIKELEKAINNYQTYGTDSKQLKGNIAEVWHEKVYNINSAVKRGKYNARAPESNEYASPDIKVSDGTNYGLKYFSEDRSIIEQAKSNLEKYKKYENNKINKGETPLTFEDYMKKNGIEENKIEELKHASMYLGQFRLIPKEQMEKSIEYLKRKINEETLKRPELVDKYKETLDMLTDRIKTDDGVESIPLTLKEAKKIADLAKEGNFNSDEFGINVEDLIQDMDIIREVINSGLSAVAISMIIRITPALIKVIYQFYKSGKLDSSNLKEIDLIEVTSEGFVRGAIASSIKLMIETSSFKSSNISSELIGVLTVFTMETLKDSIKITNGVLSKEEFIDLQLKRIFIMGSGFVGGVILQETGIPFAFYLGNFIGSMIGGIAYDQTYNLYISFCIKNGVTMFNIVEQNYILPKDILEEIGISVFDYERFKYDEFENDKLRFEKFNPMIFEHEEVEITMVRRGVIGINKIGYLPA